MKINGVFYPNSSGDVKFYSNWDAPVFSVVVNQPLHRVHVDNEDSYNLRSDCYTLEVKMYRCADMEILVAGSTPMERLMVLKMVILTRKEELFRGLSRQQVEELFEALTYEDEEFR